MPIKVVYRPKTPEEAERRVKRAQSLEVPFICLPGNPPDHRVLFESRDGHKIRVDFVEMVFNDALFMDAVSNWGEDGPLYADTLDTPIMREVYEYALKAYSGVELPIQLRNPRAS